MQLRGVRSFVLGLAGLCTLGTLCLMHSELSSIGSEATQYLQQHARSGLRREQRHILLDGTGPVEDAPLDLPPPGQPLTRQQKEALARSGRGEQAEADDYAQLLADEEQAYRAQCSAPWQAEYTELHARILAMPLEEQRLCVYRGEISGMADTLNSAITVFFYALLSRRAFKLQWEFGDITTAYTAPNVDWRFQPSDLGRHTDREFWYNHPKEGLELMFLKKNLSEIGVDSRTTHWTLNRGQLDHLFSNPHHREQLYRWGFQPETAYGCVFNYLFRPTRALLKMVRPTYEALRNPHALKIGIQIRVGDSAFAEGVECQRANDIRAKPIQAYFKCAEQVEYDQRLGFEQEVIWYVASDCHGVRVEAKKMWGQKVLTDLDYVVDHTSFERRDDPDSFIFAFAENWLLGLTDFQVISMDSTYGRLAALRSLRFRSIYTVDGFRSCGVSDYDSFRKIASHWIFT